MKPALISYSDLENRFDGPIPSRLLSGKSEDDLMLDHHRAMIRFGEGRIKDFAASLESLLARQVAHPNDPGLDAWIDRTRLIIAQHRADIENHSAALEAAEPVSA